MINKIKKILKKYKVLARLGKLQLKTLQLYHAEPPYSSMAERLRRQALAIEKAKDKIKKL